MKKFQYFTSLLDHFSSFLSALLRTRQKNIKLSEIIQAQFSKHNSPNLKISSIMSSSGSCASCGGRAHQGPCRPQCQTCSKHHAPPCRFAVSGGAHGRSARGPNWERNHATVSLFSSYHQILALWLIYGSSVWQRSRRLEI